MKAVVRERWGVQHMGKGIKTSFYSVDMGSKDLGLVTIYFNCLYYAASRLRFAASRR